MRKHNIIKVLSGRKEEIKEDDYKVRWEKDPPRNRIKAHGKDHYALIKEIFTPHAGAGPQHRWEARYYKKKGHVRLKGYEYEDGSSGEADCSWARRVVRHTLRKLDGEDRMKFLSYPAGRRDDWYIKHDIEGSDLDWTTHYTYDPGCYSHRAKTERDESISVSYICYMPDYATVRVHSGQEYSKVNGAYLLKERQEMLEAVKEVLAKHREICRLREKGKTDEADLLFLKYEREYGKTREDLREKIKETKNGH